MSEKTVESTEKTKETTNLGFEERLEGVIKDVLDFKFKALDARIDKMIDDKLKEKEIEVEAGLRKGFGLEQDPVIHNSDLVAALRKAALENSEPQKRTPASLEKAGPEANASRNPFADLLKDYGGIQ